MAKAEPLQIDLKCKDVQSKIGIEYFPEYLFYAIEDNEGNAIELIENSQRLAFSLTNEDKQTPLLSACYWDNEQIVKAIVSQAKAQDIVINAKDGNGRTPFIWACYHGLTTIVASMLEMAQEVTIDLNTKDDSKSTGFIWACKFKHSEVIDLIMAKAESLQIDLHCII